MENQAEEIVLEVLIKDKPAHVVIEKNENGIYYLTVDGEEMGSIWRSKEEGANGRWDNLDLGDDYYLDYYKPIEEKLDELGK